MAGTSGYTELSDNDAEPSTQPSTSTAAPPAKGIKPLPIGISVRIRRTFELNTKNQTFGCTLSLLTWWYTNEDASFPKDMPQDIPSNVAGALSDWTPKWRPQIAIKNVMRVARPAECTYALIKNPKFKEGNADSWQNPMKYIVLADERHYVHIYSHFNLASFPLDIQQFKIELELRGADCSLLCFVPYDQCGDVDFDDGVTTADCFPGRCVFEDMSLVPPEDLTDQEVAKGWTMYQPPDAPVPHLRYRLYNSDPKDSRQGESYSSLTVELRYCRRPFYYILNVATIMLIIGTLALSTWGISENSGRLKPLFTLLLTTVAFKLVLVGMLPPVAYQTYLDLYVLGCMFTLMSAILSNMIMIAMSKRYDIDLVDDIIGHTLMGWWAAFNLFSVVFACYEVSDDPKPISEAVAESTRRRKSSLWAGRV